MSLNSLAHIHTQSRTDSHTHTCGGSAALEPKSPRPAKHLVQNAKGLDGMSVKFFKLGQSVRHENRGLGPTPPLPRRRRAAVAAPPSDIPWRSWSARRTGGGDSAETGSVPRLGISGQGEGQRKQMLPDWLVGSWCTWQRTVRDGIETQHWWDLKNWKAKNYEPSTMLKDGRSQWRSENNIDSFLLMVAKRQKMIGCNAGRDINSNLPKLALALGQFHTYSLVQIKPKKVPVRSSIHVGLLSNPETLVKIAMLKGTDPEKR